MKALEKERSRRYETANAFADDIDRYLNDDVSSHVHQHWVQDSANSLRNTVFG